MERYSIAVRALWNDVDKAHADGLDSILIKNFPPNPFGLTDPDSEEVNFVNSCVNSLTQLHVEFSD
jgi:predicted TIM-barrel enzyme